MLLMRDMLRARSMRRAKMLLLCYMRLWRDMPLMRVIAIIDIDIVARYALMLRALFVDTMPYADIVRCPIITPTILRQPDATRDARLRRY